MQHKSLSASYENTQEAKFFDNITHFYSTLDNKLFAIAASFLS